MDGPTNGWTDGRTKWRQNKGKRMCVLLITIICNNKRWLAASRFFQGDHEGGGGGRRIGARIANSQLWEFRKRSCRVRHLERDRINCVTKGMDVNKSILRDAAGVATNARALRGVAWARKCREWRKCYAMHFLRKVGGGNCFIWQFVLLSRKRPNLQNFFHFSFAFFFLFQFQFLNFRSAVWY